MTDRHLQLLRVAARGAERSLSDYEDGNDAVQPTSPGRRQRLARALERTKQHLAGAEARRLIHRAANVGRH